MENCIYIGNKMPNYWAKIRNSYEVLAENTEDTM
jgi:hypothetical protein